MESQDVDLSTSPPSRVTTSDASPPILVLIGPAATGKTTLGAAVASQLAVPFLDLDDVGDRYYAEVGWSIDRLVDRISTVGRLRAEREWEGARAHAVARAIGSCPGGVLALGAGHTVLTDEKHADHVRQALERCPFVVLLFPYRDRDASLAELRRRSIATKGTTWIAEDHDFLAEWLDSPSNVDLSTHIYVTADSSVEQAAHDLATIISARTGYIVRSELTRATHERRPETIVFGHSPNSLGGDPRRSNA